ncbi:MAG TPA: hypothetical protein PLK40_08995 [Bacteroidaceae bacterium]|nr:hypothetical protein [Bacteroidaceae bacterium]
MKRFFMAAIAAIFVAVSSIHAGGLLTNSNQSASFLRMMARDASTDIFSVYYNPAGLSFLPHDGFFLSIDNQSAFQTRDANSRLLNYGWNLDGDTSKKMDFEGDASAPIIPTIMAAYKQDKLTFSGMLGFTSGGGKATFNNGLPMFQTLVVSTFANLPLGGDTRLQLNPSQYDVDMNMKGTQYIFGGQFGITYQINDWLSVYGGGRMNFFFGSQKGSILVNATDPAVQAQTKALGLPGSQLADVALDVDQSGWGVTPIIGVDASFGKWNFAAKYEFMTNLNIENKSNSPLRANILYQESAQLKALLASYDDGVNTPSDIPAILTLGARYEIIPTVHVSAGYHYYFDKDAGMADDKQKLLTHGTIEWLAGAEWDITDRVTLSAGYQNTNYGLSDGYQRDTSFSCDSYSIGFGGRIKMNDAVAFNIGYMQSFYDDYTGMTTYQTENTYSRTNKVFGFGAEFVF